MENTAVVIVAHGDRAGRERNTSLLSHSDCVRKKLDVRHVACGVLNGEPAADEVFEEISQGHFDKLLIYPFFMSDGYFVDRVLPARIAKFNLTGITRYLTPLGMEERLPEIFLSRIMEVAISAEFLPRTTRLVVVGHGSKFGRASAVATEKMVKFLAALNNFTKIDTAYLEERPFLHNVLGSEKTPIVVAGFFASDGMHAYEDVPVAIYETGANAVYTGPIGIHPEIPDLICGAVSEKLQSVI